MAGSITDGSFTPDGSRAALPIACDALNARTMTVREYHYIFCAVVARKLLPAFSLLLTFVIIGAFLQIAF